MPLLGEIAGLLTSVFFLTRHVHGLGVAALTTALLIGSPGFLELASSCMVEIPGLAPTVAALSVLLIGRRNKWHGAELATGSDWGVFLVARIDEIP